MPAERISIAATGFADEGLPIREVSATLQEFRHGLLLAFPNGVAAEGDTLRVSDDRATMEIRLSPQAPRIIAALRLPSLQVAIRFTAGAPADRERMLARMDRAMHRGGG